MEDSAGHAIVDCIGIQGYYSDMYFIYFNVMNKRTSKFLGRLGMIAAILLLTACADSRGIRPTAHVIDVGAIEAGAAIKGSAIEPWTNEKWWRVYGDPQLDDLVTAALAGSPSVKIAADRVALAQAAAATSHASLLPTVNAKAEAQRLRFSAVGETPPPLAGEVSWDANVAAQLSFDLDLWGRNRKALDAAVGTVRATSLDARVSILALQTAIVRSYLQLSYAYALEDVLKATLTQRQSVFDITQRRHSAGLATSIQVHQAETEVTPVKVQLDQTDNRIVTLRDQLAALTGSGPGFGEKITRPKLQINQAVTLPSIIPAELLGRRPDIVAARWRVESAGYGIDSAKAAFYPNVNLSAFAGLQSLNLNELFEGRAATFGAAPAITLPLFDGGRLRANLAGRTAAYDLAIDDYNQTVLAAIRDVSDQIATAESTARQRQQAAAAVSSAKLAYDEAQQGFRAGLTDFLTVLSTQTTVLAQQQQFEQIAAAELDARALLMQALGGGFHDADNSQLRLQKAVDAHPLNRDPEMAAKGNTP